MLQVQYITDALGSPLLPHTRAPPEAVSKLTSFQSIQIPLIEVNFVLFDLVLTMNCVFVAYIRSSYVRRSTPMWVASPSPLALQSTL